LPYLPKGFRSHEQARAHAVHTPSRFARFTVLFRNLPEAHFVEGESSAGPGRCQFERFLAQDEQKQSKYKKEMVLRLAKGFS